LRRRAWLDKTGKKYSSKLAGAYAQRLKNVRRGAKEEKARNKPLPRYEEVCDLEEEGMLRSTAAQAEDMLRQTMHAFKQANEDGDFAAYMQLEWPRDYEMYKQGRSYETWLAMFEEY
jgi:hypothetical protein